MSFRGGQKNSFSFCLLEYFSENSRWAIKSLFDTGTSKEKDIDSLVSKWLINKEVDVLTVDFPRSFPPCHNCQLECKGIDSCNVFDVKTVTSKIKEILDQDVSRSKGSPKEYEHDRNADDLFDFRRDILEKDASDYMLSRSFRRKLKKGFIPYWNRGIDFYIWYYYYDQLLKLFNSSFNSFGNASYMILSRFAFIERELPKTIHIAEAANKILLIELLRRKIITKNDILELSSFEDVASARISIIKKVEKNFNIFMYENDLDRVAHSYRYFDAFLMSINGLLYAENKIKKLPSWCGVESFILPDF